MNDSRFTGFSPGFFSFLRELAENNNKEWMNRHRFEYKTQVLATIKDFVAELGQTVRALNPDLDTDPRVGRTISPIANARSKMDHAPYRPFIYISYPMRDNSRSNGPLLYARVSASGVSVGFYPGKQRPPRKGPIQQSISRNLRAFQSYLTDRRIAKKYWELTDGNDGAVKKWPLPKTARRWIDLESFTVGEFFGATEQMVSGPKFLERARAIILDLYPLWLFATSDDLKRDLELYRENAMALSRPLTGSKRSSHDRRQLGSAGRKATIRSARSLR